ncbi:MAG: RHS repeat-associated core domain-containing protein [Nanoarchaeota archaeon]
MRKELLILAIGLVSLLLLSLFLRESIGRAISSVQLSAEGGEVQLPRSSSGTSYVYGKGLIASKTTDSMRYHYQDTLGSNRITTNDKGILTSRYAAYPYGKTLTSGSFSTYSQKYTFTGKEDDGKLQYFGARYYDPRIGRFASIDSLLVPPSPYAYCLGNPLVVKDPDGNAPLGITWVTDIYDDPKSRLGRQLHRELLSVDKFNRLQGFKESLVVIPEEFVQPNLQGSYTLGTTGMLPILTLDAYVAFINAREHLRTIEVLDHPGTYYEVFLESAYRPVRRNTIAKGKPRSSHLDANSIDIFVRRVDSEGNVVADDISAFIPMHYIRMVFKQFGWYNYEDPKPKEQFHPNEYNHLTYDPDKHRPKKEFMFVDPPPDHAAEESLV